MSDNIIEMINIWKIYSNGFIANRGINFSVKTGEIHGLLGENGAGKSTLMNILFGFEKATEGKIIYKNSEVHNYNADRAINMGIGMVHQHFMLVPSLTVVENIILGIEPRKGFSTDITKAEKFVSEEMKKYGLPVPLDEKIKNITVGMRQRVEILKTLVRGADLIILDEPTAVLTPQETSELFTALRTLTEKGKTIIFITHKLGEIKEIADRITVLRKGAVVGNAQVNDLTEKDISKMMIGRDVELKIKKNPVKAGEKIMEIKNLSFTGNDGIKKIKNISFSIREGEITGIAGIEGNGQTELVSVITGMSAIQSGEIKFMDKNYDNTEKFRKAGMSYIPADRMEIGVSENNSLEENLISDRFKTKEFSKFGILSYKTIKNNALDKIKKFDIRTDSYKSPVKMLSGGNIQKAVVAREFTSGAKFIVADQPTRGIDIAAADFIRRLLVKEREKKVGVLLVSADLTELIEVSDRIIVMYKGEITAKFDDLKKVDESVLGEYMLGIKRMNTEEIGDLE